MVMTPALAGWLAFVGIYSGVVNRQWISALVAIGMSIAALGVVGLYFVDFQVELSPQRIDPLGVLKSGFAFVTMGFGMSAMWIHDALGDALRTIFVHVGLASWAEKRWPYAFVGGVAGLFIVVLPFIRAWMVRPLDRFRILGLGFFLAACACLALAIGLGRGGGDVMDQYRYIVLATPLFAWMYLIWTLHGCGIGRFVQVILFVTFCVLLPPNFEAALASAREDRTAVDEFSKKMEQGVPLMRLVDEFAKVFVLDDDQPARERLAGYILLMKKHGDKHYANLRHDELALNVRINMVKPMPPGLLLDSGWHGMIDGRLWSGVKPVIKFWLPETQKINPLRLRMLATTFGLQTLEVVLNGSAISTFRNDGGPARWIEIDLPPQPDKTKPAEPGQLREYNVLKFVLPNARSQKTAGTGDDERRLGLNIEELEFVTK